MLSRYPLSDARIFRSNGERRAASRMSSHVTIPGVRLLRRSQAANASSLAARLAGSSATANAGCVTSMTGNLRPSAVVANTMARLSCGREMGLHDTFQIRWAAMPSRTGGR